MSEMWLGLRPNDILFFRGPEPFNAGETGYVRSEFPPTPQVLQGAIRTALLEANGIRLQDYIEDNARNERERAVLDAVGKAGQHDEMGLDLRGPFLLHEDELLLPAPLDLIASDANVVRLAPSAAPLSSDLGCVRLPTAIEAAPGAKSVEGQWLPARIVEKHLRGEQTQKTHLFNPLAADSSIPVRSRAQYEPKVGIARDRRSQTVVEGMLYAIAPLRLGENLRLAIHVAGIPEESELPFALQLGGEGRFALVERLERPSLPSGHRDEVLRQIDETGRFRLILLQPALFDQGWLPDGFERRTIDNTDCWQGTLLGIDCTLTSACVEKPRRVGGWDLKTGAPKPVRECVPAGSVYFFETDASGREVVEALDNRKIGGWSRIGFGHSVVGVWEK